MVEHYEVIKHILEDNMTHKEKRQQELIDSIQDEIEEFRKDVQGDDDIDVDEWDDETILAMMGYDDD